MIASCGNGNCFEAFDLSVVIVVADCLALSRIKTEPVVECWVIKFKENIGNPFCFQIYPFYFEVLGRKSEAHRYEVTWKQDTEGELGRWLRGWPWCHVWPPRVDPWSPPGRRKELSLSNWPLASGCILWCIQTCSHTCSILTRTHPEKRKSLRSTCGAHWKNSSAVCRVLWVPPSALQKQKNGHSMPLLHRKGGLVKEITSVDNHIGSYSVGRNDFWTVVYSLCCTVATLVVVSNFWKVLFWV